MTTKHYLLITLISGVLFCMGGCSIGLSPHNIQPAQATIDYMKTITTHPNGLTRDVSEYSIELFNDQNSPAGMSAGLRNGEPYVSTSGSEPVISNENPMLNKLKWVGYIAFALGPLLLLMKFSGFPLLAAIPWAGPLYPMLAGIVLIWLDVILATFLNIVIALIIIGVILFATGYLDNVVRVMKGQKFEDPKPEGAQNV
jgi:hypothetical protein